MLPLLATYASTTALPALASAAVYAETVLATSTPTLLIGFAAGAYMTHADNFKDYFSKLLAPTKAQIASSALKAIILDGAITYHFTHDPIASVKNAVTALPSYFIRAIHEDPFTACVVGAGKYASGGKSVIAGCANHALYSKTFDFSGATGPFIQTLLVEAGDHYAKKALKNETFSFDDGIDATLVGGISGLVVAKELIPALNYISGAQGAPSPQGLTLKAIGTLAAGEVITGINYRNFTKTAQDFIEENFNISISNPLEMLGNIFNTTLAEYLPHPEF